MTPQGRQILKQRLIWHEGVELKEYVDTLNNVTIGVGDNLTARGMVNSPIYKNGITYQKAMQDLDSDIDYFISELSKFDWFTKLNDARQICIVDMAFMGLQNLLKFTNMIAAIDRDDYDAAANEITNSLWATQVQPSRVQDNVNAMRTGTIN